MKFYGNALYALFYISLVVSIKTQQPLFRPTTNWVQIPLKTFYIFHISYSGPNLGVISEDTNIGLYPVWRVVDEEEEKKWSQNRALGTPLSTFIQEEVLELLTTTRIVRPVRKEWFYP